MPALWVLLDLVVTALAFTVLASVLGYPWQLAVLLAFALGALSYSTRRTVSNLRTIWRREPPFATDDDPSSDEPGASRSVPDQDARG
ncbi:MAG: hypothetical protein AAGC60_22170 [Acidobacteriota bacterium]